MIKPEIAVLVDEQFERVRKMLLRKQTFMLRKDYVHNEAFVVGSFKNILIAYDLLHQTVKENYDTPQSGS